jgi:predicted fused transcriptional regulator/phosphomethylpyrimidine kinase
MEPITTAVAAVAAASNAIAFIKARINDVQSVADISQQVSTLFDCQKKINEERNKQASVGDISFKSSMDAVLEAKKLQEQMNDIRTMINMRFGPDTWQEIVDLHNKKLKEQKEAQAQARREAVRKAKEFEETIKTTLLIAGIVAVTIALFAFLMVSVARAVGIA